MRKIGKIRIATWIIAIVPLILVAAMYNRLPERIPTNWGFDGSVSYGDKNTLWGLACMSPGLAIMFALLPKIDPRKKNYDKFRGLYDGFALFMMLFMLGIISLTISESLNPGRLSVEFLVTVFCGLLFAYMGNMMPKVKSNFFVGVRTPWALSNTEVWNKTHRLAGYLFFFGGLLLVALAFFLKGYALYVSLMIIVVVTSLTPTVMSYVWFRRFQNDDEPEN